VSLPLLSYRCCPCHLLSSWCRHPRCNGIVAIDAHVFCHCRDYNFRPNDDGIVAIADAQTSLPLLRWCCLPRNNGIVTLDPQWCCCPHCNGVVAVFKLASLPCFSLQKAALVRLDNLGLVKNHSCFIYNPKCIKLLEQQLELQHSIGRSEEIRKSSALEKESAEMDKLSPLLSEAILMYKANETSKRGFTKDHIKSILLTVFGITPPNSGPLSSKSEWLKLLLLA
jgi:hypothetical protein